MNKDSASTDWLNLSVLVVGELSTALGLMAVFGWYPPNLRLLQVLPMLVPIQYNAALGFILCGIGSLLITFGRPGLAIASGIAASIGLVVVYFGIDQPRAKVLGESQSSLSEAAVVVGLLVALLLALAIYFAQKARLEAREAEAVKQEMGNQITQRKWMEGQIQRNLERVRALREIEAAITSTLDLRTVLDLLLEKIDLFLPCSAATVRLLNKQSGLLEPVTCRNLDQEEWKAEKWKGGRGVPNVTFENKTPAVIGNVQTDPRTRDVEFFRKHGLVSYLGIPLTAKGEVLGVLSFYTKEEHEFNPEEVEFLSTLAEQAAIAMDNARLFEETETRSRKLRVLSQVARLMISSLDQRGVMEAIVNAAVDLLGVDVIQLWVADEASQVLRLQASQGREDLAATTVKQIGKGHGVIGAIWEKDGPTFISDLREEPSWLDTCFLDGTSLCSFAGLPLTVEGQVVGVVSFFDRRSRIFTSEDQEIMALFADQAALAIHNSQLYEQMANLAGVAGDLARSNRVKDEFLSVVSHELRTPLNVVIGYTEMIREKLLGEINPDQEEALKKVLGRSKDLLSMINSILEATRIQVEAVKVESQDVNVVYFLDELRSNYDIPLGKELTLNWDYPSDLPIVKTDSEKLKHILQNLINNAIKFTDRGQVSISARYFTGPKAIEFKVADTGIGIPRESLSIIFDLFRQVDGSETRSHGGVGIGLYIVKKYSELLGGAVRVESEHGKGSTFYVKLPLEVCLSHQGLKAA